MKTIAHSALTLLALLSLLVSASCALDTSDTDYDLASEESALLDLPIGGLPIGDVPIEGTGACDVLDQMGGLGLEAVLALITDLVEPLLGDILGNIAIFDGLDELSNVLSGAGCPTP